MTCESERTLNDLPTRGLRAACAEGPAGVLLDGMRQSAEQGERPNQEPRVVRREGSAKEGHVPAAQNEDVPRGELQAQGQAVQEHRPGQSVLPEVLG